VLPDFTPYLADRAKCIDRSPSGFEFARLVGVHPYRDDLSEQRILVVGDSTDLGVAVWHFANASGQRIAHTGCQQSIDWAADDAAIVIER
jgi:hypothetical protein